MLRTKCDDCAFFLKEEKENFCFLNIDKKVKQLYKNSEIQKNEEGTFINNFVCKYMVGPWYEENLTLEERAQKRLLERSVKIIAVVWVEGEIDISLYENFDAVFFVNPFSSINKFIYIKNLIKSNPKYTVVQKLMGGDKMDDWSEGAQKAIKESDKNMWISYIGCMSTKDKIQPNLPEKIKNLIENESRALLVTTKEKNIFFIQDLLLHQINYGYPVEIEKTKSIISSPIDKVEHITKEEGESSQWAIANFTI